MARGSYPRRPGCPGWVSAPEVGGGHGSATSSAPTRPTPSNITEALGTGSSALSRISTTTIAPGSPKTMSATDLRTDGIDAILDQWDLVPVS